MTTTRSLEGQRHTCGGTYRLISEPGVSHLRGRTVVTHQEYFRCDNCGDEVVTIEQARKVEAAAATQLRDEEKYLHPNEITALREKLGLSKALIEEALGLGEKTFIRWECGKVLQTRAMDNLLRLIRYNPDNLRYLAEFHGVDIRRTAASDSGECNFSVCDVAVPRSLQARLAKLANDEGVSLQEYVLSALAEHATAAPLQKEVRRLNETLSRTAGWSEVKYTPADEVMLAHREVYGE